LNYGIDPTARHKPVPTVVRITLSNGGRSVPGLAGQCVTSLTEPERTRLENQIARDLVSTRAVTATDYAAGAPAELKLGLTLTAKEHFGATVAYVMLSGITLGVFNLLGGPSSAGDFAGAMTARLVAPDGQLLWKAAFEVTESRTFKLYYGWDARREPWAGALGGLVEQLGAALTRDHERLAAVIQRARSGARVTPLVASLEPKRIAARRVTPRSMIHYLSRSLTRTG